MQTIQFSELMLGLQLSDQHQKLLWLRQNSGFLHFLHRNPFLSFTPTPNPQHVETDCPTKDKLSALTPQHQSLSTVYNLQCLAIGMISNIDKILRTIVFDP
jgi:hypothetical protein